MQFAQNTGAGAAPMALARTGRYVICSIEAAGPVSWSKQAAVDAAVNAVTAARTRGVKTGKYGVLAWSMGGQIAANLLKQQHANIAGMWTWSSMLDLDWAHSTAGHNPIANNGTWTTEIETAFGSWAASAGYRVWDEPATFQGLGVPWKVCHATDDATVPYSVSSSFVANVNDSNVTMRAPAVTGDHLGLFQNVDPSEVVGFFDSLSW
jgi:hypothetical protein